MATNKQLIERWQNVLRVLRALTPHQRRKHFDMETFGYQTHCGTVACAAGYCGLDPWFRRRGFRMDFGPSDQDSLEDFVADYFDAGSAPLGELVANLVLQTPSGSTYDDVLKFFGDGAYGVFLDYRRRPVSKVIREVRAHIKTLQAKE